LYNFCVIVVSFFYKINLHDDAFFFFFTFQILSNFNLSQFLLFFRQLLRGAFGNDTIDDTSGIDRIDLMDYASADYFTRTEGRTTGYIETIDFWNTQNITITTLINNGWI
jgi:hypothetical protein